MATEILTLDQFPHNELIAESKIKVSDFDDNLKQVITDFNKKHQTYKSTKREDFLPSLKALSTLIMQNIYDYYVDKSDQEVKIGDEPTKGEIKKVAKEIKEEIKDTPPGASDGKPEPVPTPEPPTPTPTPQPVPTPTPEPTEEEPSNTNEKALFLLKKEGIVEGITKAMLKEKGFDTGAWGPLGITGCRVGKYVLYKGFSDSTFKLS